MPPPPPPPPAPVPPRGLKPPGNVGGGAPLDRNALLSSIQKGAKLKKAVTNDRSAPIVGGTGTQSSSNGSVQGSTSTSNSNMANGGAPQLGGLFAGGMPKLRPTGRARNAPDITDSGPRTPFSGAGIGTPMIPVGKKPSAPPTPPGSAKPSLSSSQSHLNYAGDSNQSPSNGYLPPSPKPSSKSNPAPPPPPSNRKPAMPDRGRHPHLEVPPPTSKPVHTRPTFDFQTSNQNDERHPPLPAKPSSFKSRPDPGYRGAPPRPPSSSKPNLPPKSPDLKPSSEPRRPSIDRSVSLREPSRPPMNPIRVGTSAESPAAPFRVNPNHREAPPIPNTQPKLSKTVGRAAGVRMMPALRPPSDKPPKPPQRPAVAAPPPPSQPPPPPPSHRGGATTTGTTAGGKADVPLPPIPHNIVPPPPPERNESTRTTSSKQPGDFESKFSNQFRSRHQFPLPLTYNNVPKIYPSTSNGKNQRRAPLPPTSAQQQQQHTKSNSTTAFTPPSNTSSHTLSSSKPSPQGHSFSFPHHSMGNNPPPPPPPHAPLHLQMDRKFFGTEASHC